MPDEQNTGEIPPQETDRMPMSEESKIVLEQSFIGSHKRLEQSAERFNDGSAFAAQESKQGYLLQKQLMQATAQNLAEKEGLADTLMQLKSAGSFPPNSLPTT